MYFPMQRFQDRSTNLFIFDINLFSYMILLIFDSSLYMITHFKLTLNFLVSIISLDFESRRRTISSPKSRMDPRDYFDP